MERIYSPLLEYDDGDKSRVGYLLVPGKFKFFKAKLGTNRVEPDQLYMMPRRKIIHFYVNHFDPDFKYKDDDRGDMMGLNSLINSFTEIVIRNFCFTLGQLLSFLLFDCKIFPFDVEVVIGANEADKVATLYVLDFNECYFIKDEMAIDVIVSEAARSMHSKDGKHYFPNHHHDFYEDFVMGMIDDRMGSEIAVINDILNKYNQLFD